MHQIRDFFLRFKQKEKTTTSLPKTWIIKRGGKKETAIREIAIRELDGTLNPERSYVITASLDNEFLSMAVNASRVIDAIVEETKRYSKADIKISEVQEYPSFYTGLVPTTRVGEFSFSTK